MNERLLDLEFYPDTEGHSICSYKYKNIAIDIMPSEDSAIGVSSRWYKPSFNYIQEIILDNQLTIKILPALYFLATKFEAFKDRRDIFYPRSHYFEDTIYMLDNRTTIIEEILATDDEVKKYLKEGLRYLNEHPQSHKILSIYIHPLVVEERFTILMEKINAILE